MSSFPVGSKLFFPNVTMRLMRSSLPPHQAIFRCPPSLNKLDIKEYLVKLYDIQITDLRTLNYASKRTLKSKKGHSATKGNMFSTGAYKKVVVTMTEDFVFPDPPVLQGQEGAMRLMEGVAPTQKKKIKDLIRRMAAERNIDLAQEKKAGEANAMPSDAPSSSDSPSDSPAPSESSKSQ